MKAWTFNGPEQEWFTRAQIAAYLDVDERTLRRWISEGSFPKGIKVSPNKPLRWSGADLAAYLYLRSRCAEVSEEVEETPTE